MNIRPGFPPPSAPLAGAERTTFLGAHLVSLSCAAGKLRFCRMGSHSPGGQAGLSSGGHAAERPPRPAQPPPPQWSLWSPGTTTASCTVWACCWETQSVPPGLSNPPASHSTHHTPRHVEGSPFTPHAPSALLILDNHAWVQRQEGCGWRFPEHQTFPCIAF